MSRLVIRFKLRFLLKTGKPIVAIPQTVPPKLA